MENFELYNYTNYKSFSLKSLSSNSAVGCYRVHYYSFMSYGDAVFNNFANIRFGISSRPPNLSGTPTGTLRYGLYDASSVLPPQFSYLSRFYKSGTWYKANTNLATDSAVPLVINFNESKRYIYTCSWSYDYNIGYKTIFVATSVVDYETGVNLFYNAQYLTPYNNTGAFLDCDQVSPMICVTSATDGVNLEILTKINPSWLYSMVGTSAGLTNAINVFDP